MNISGVHGSAANIFSNEQATLSRINSSGGASSEADYRALSHKDSSSATNISKDEISYEYNLAEWDQMREWEKEEAEKYRLFD